MFAFLTSMIVASANGFLQPAGLDCGVGEEPQLLTPLVKLIHYPEEARKKGIEGKVEVEVRVEEDGSVKKVKILRSDDTIFNQEAIRVMQSARFKPTFSEERDSYIKVWITQMIYFRLKDIPKPPPINTSDTVGK